MQRQKWLLCVVIFIAFLSLYLLTLSHNLAAAHDSMSYLCDIDSKTWNFHPHHLLYIPFSILWVGLLRGIGITSDSILVIESLNAVFGAAAVAIIFYILLERFQNNTRTTFSTIILIGCSFGFWLFSISIEVLTIPLFFLLLSLLILLRKPLRQKDLVLAGIFHGIAILCFQAHVLFVIPALVRIIFVKENTIYTPRTKAVIIYLIPAACIAIIGYAAVMMFSVKPTSWNEAFLWITKYAHEMSDAWTVPSLNSLKKALIGFSHSIIGGHFFFGIPWFASHVNQIFGKHELRDEFYIVRSASPFISEYLLSASLLLAGCIGFIILNSLSSIKKIYSEQRPLLLPIGIWLIVYVLFFFIWDPVDFQFWIIQSMLCWVVLDRMLIHQATDHPKRTAVFRFTLPFLLLAINFFGSIIPLHNESNDYFYVQSKALAAQTSAQDVIITDNPWMEGDYYKRFTRNTVYSPQELTSDSLRQSFIQRIRATVSSGGKIWLTFPIPERDTTDIVLSSFRVLWQSTIDSISVQKTRQAIGSQEYEVVRGENK